MSRRGQSPSFPSVPHSASVPPPSSLRVGKFIAAPERLSMRKLLVDAAFDQRAVRRRPDARPLVTLSLDGRCCFRASFSRARLQWNDFERDNTVYVLLEKHVRRRALLLRSTDYLARLSSAIVVVCLFSSSRSHFLVRSHHPVYCCLSCY